MKPSYEKVVIQPGSSFAYFRRRDREFPFEWHVHPEYELTLIVRGRGERFVGDHIAPYGPGDLVLIGPNLPHTWRSMGAGRSFNEAVVIQFDAHFLGRSFFEAPEMRPVRQLLTSSARGMHFVKPHRANVVNRMAALADRAPSQRLLDLLAILLTLADDRRMALLGSEGCLSRPQAQPQQRIDRVCRFIHDHLAEPMSVAQVARHMHMAPATLSRFFRKTTGRTVVRYINEARVGRACELLLTTDLSISEVGYKAGFGNLSYFNRRFLQTKGMTPRAFRKSYVNADGDAAPTRAA